MVKLFSKLNTVANAEEKGRDGFSIEILIYENHQLKSIKGNEKIG